MLYGARGANPVAVFERPVHESETLAGEPDDRGVMALKLVYPDGSEQAYFH